MEGHVKTIHLIGGSGDGKSELAKAITGRDDFVTSRGGHSETSETSMREGTLQGQPCRVIDTPGINDTNRNDGTHLQATAQFLRRHVDRVDGILYVHPITDPRAGDTPKKIVRMTREMIHTREVWKHFGIAFTKCVAGFEEDYIVDVQTAFTNCVRAEIEQIEGDGFVCPPLAVFTLDSKKARTGTDARSAAALADMARWLGGFVQGVSTDGVVAPDPVFVSAEEETRTVTESTDVTPVYGMVCKEESVGGIVLKSIVYGVTFSAVDLFNEPEKKMVGEKTVEKKVVQRRINRKQYDGREVRGEWETVYEYNEEKATKKDEICNDSSPILDSVMAMNPFITNPLKEIITAALKK